MMKKIFDLCFSSIFLLLLFPLVLIISLILYYYHGTKIIFIQSRGGFKNKNFNIYKFKTMYDFNNKEKKRLPDIKRITKIGMFLRQTSLDEIPNLINVLKGEMSFVGPRPLLAKYAPLYTKEQNKRHNVKPGITGWTQVNGRNSLSWDDKFKLDVWYVENHSFLLDLKIIFLTIRKVLKRESINNSKSVSCKEFKGE